ncbi:MAG: restriction endonuclease subunit S [Pseudomonadota bacterium]
MMWSAAALGKFTKMVGGGTPSKNREDFWNGDIPWVSPKDMSFREIYDAEDHITKAAVNGSATQVVPPGSILMVVRSGILVRRFPVAIARVPLALNQDMKAILPGELVQPEFLAYALAASEQTVLGQCVKRGATVHSIDIGKLQRLEFPVPAKSEQLRIVEILDQADALRRKRAEADAKAARILPALFYKMFGDPATNPKGWDTGNLGDVILETQYGTSTKANASGNGLPVLRMNNIDSDGYLELADIKYVELSRQENKKYALANGDILFNRTNSKELVGKTGMWRGEMQAVAASYLIRVRVNQERAIPKFIWAYMNCPFIKQMLLNRCRRAIGMANINAKELRNLPLIIPKKDRQMEFSNHLDGLEILRNQWKQSTKAIYRLFDTLLHRAFAGDLTARWREAHMKALLAEMEAQAKALNQAGEL